MILIYTDTRSDFSKIFNTSDYAVPFVDKTLLELSLDIWAAAAEKLGEELVVYFPDNWNLEGNSYTNFMDIVRKNSGHVIVVAGAAEVPADGIDTDKIVLVKDHPGTLYGNIVFSNGAFPSVKNEGGLELETVDTSNYIDVSSDYMENSEGHNPNGVVAYGRPVILGRVDENSVICGPCFISEDSEVTNSTILPGSVILNSRITNTEVFASVIHDSLVTDTKIRESIISGAVVIKTNLVASTVPHGAKLSGRKI